MSRMTDEKFLNSSAMICCDLWAQTRTQSTFEIVFFFFLVTQKRGVEAMTLKVWFGVNEGQKTPQPNRDGQNVDKMKLGGAGPSFLFFCCNWQNARCHQKLQRRLNVLMYRVPSQQRRNISKIKEERYCCLFLGLQAINEQENTGAIVCVWHWKGPVRQRYVRRDACGNVGMMSLSHTQTRQTSGLFHPSSWLTYLLPPLFLATVIQQQQRKKASLPHCFSARKKTRIRDRIVRMFFRQVWVGNPFDLKVIRHIATDWPQWQRIDVFLITCMTFSRWPGIKHTRI